MAAESQLNVDDSQSVRPLPNRGAVRPLERDDFARDVWSVLGMAVDIAGVPQAVQAIEAAVRDRRRLSFVTPNVNFLVRALADPAARREILDADLSFADGAPLVVMAKMLGAPLSARCAGSDIFDALRRRPGFAGRRLRVFFFGGREGSAEAAAAVLDAERRGVEPAGFLNPGFGDVEQMSADAVIDAINAADADFVLVALGAAKGERWIARNRDRLQAPVIAHLGAVVDFTAGAVARAPRWVCKSGLEWAWRIKEEPSLWRRYWRDAAALAGIVATRLAPALIAGKGRAKGAPAEARIVAEPSGVRIVLTGDLVAAALAPVRRAFREAARSGVPVTLDLAEAGRLDAAFLGQVLMLEKATGGVGLGLFLAGASRRHRRLFAAHAMAYPVTASAAESAAAPAQEGAGIAAAV